MDQALRRITPVVLLVLALLVWFEPLLPLDGIRERLGETGLLRFVTGVLCIYCLLLVMERQRMEARFTEVLGTFQKFYRARSARSGHGSGDAAAAGAGDPAAASGPGSDEESEQSLAAVAILTAALGSAEADLRETAVENLQRLTGQEFGDDQAAWQAWLADARAARAAVDRDGGSRERRAERGN